MAIELDLRQAVARVGGLARPAVQDDDAVPSPLAEFWRRFSRDRAAVVGGMILLAAIVIALVGPAIAPYGPTTQQAELRMAPPGTGGYLLGGDQLGRDILSRLLHGARLSLAAAAVPLVISLACGLSLGMIAGYYGGAVDMAISRCVDIVLAFPAILLAIGIVSALGPALQNAMLAVAIVAIPSFTRIVRSAVIGIRGVEYVQASRALGAPDRRILGRHILPNCLAPVIVYSTLELGRMIIFASGLSFLGLGVQPPTPEWGAMLADGRNVLATAPHVATIPGLAIFLVAVGANLLGDGLRDTLDPRMRGAD
jgi:peptide/nickel transport system permease protein